METTYLIENCEWKEGRLRCHFPNKGSSLLLEGGKATGTSEYFRATRYLWRKRRRASQTSKGHPEIAAKCRKRDRNNELQSYFHIKRWSRNCWLVSRQTEEYRQENKKNVDRVSRLISPSWCWSSLLKKNRRWGSQDHRRGISFGWERNLEWVSGFSLSKIVKEWIYTRKRCSERKTEKSCRTLEKTKTHGHGYEEDICRRNRGLIMLKLLLIRWPHYPCDEWNNQPCCSRVSIDRSKLLQNWGMVK